MFGPLVFEESEAATEETHCLLCSTVFNLNVCLPLFLKHIFDAHKIVIEDAQNIDNLPEYITYWRDKFVQTPIEQIIPAVVVSPTDNKYFVLSTLLKEDKLLRHKLKLEAMLKKQESERSELTFKMPCLFCKLSFEGKRSDFITHLSRDHNIRLGNPQNLVYVDELLARISEKLSALQCIYCEKTFTDRNVLKDHMRKKQHKRINPSNKSYDKFFAVNYLDADRRWQNSTIEEDIPEPCKNSEEEYGDWNDVEDTITCLFCTYNEKDVNKLCLHINSKHRFNFYEVCKHLDFYQKVKLVNYVRRQVHRLQCICCEASFDSRELLEAHMQELEHCHLPEVKEFDQPEFYFPTFENDSFLHYLEDIDD